MLKLEYALIAAAVSLLSFLSAWWFNKKKELTNDAEDMFTLNADVKNIIRLADSISSDIKEIRADNKEIRDRVISLEIETRLKQDTLELRIEKLEEKI